MMMKDLILTAYLPEVTGNPFRPTNREVLNSIFRRAAR
jgi:hypothetical protein